MTDEGPAASIVTYLLPIVAVGLGAIVLGEAITPTVVIGAAVVLCSVALVRRERRRGERDVDEHGPSISPRTRSKRRA